MQKKVPMLHLVRSLVPPLLSLVLLMMGSGLFNTFISVRLEIDGYSVETIGAVTSALYLGILVGSLRAEAWISQVGHIRSYVAFASLSAALILMQAFWIHPFYWCLLRFLGGICIAGIFVIIESWLLIQSPAHMRGGILSVYLAVFYGALSAGQLLINLSDPEGLLPFCTTAILCSLSTLPLILQKIVEPKIETATPLPLPQLFRISPIGFIGGIVSGMLLAAVYGLVPVYAKEMHFTISEIGTLMAIIIFGGLSLQWPLGRWADQGDRKKVLYIASFLTALCGLTLPFLQPHPFFYLMAWLFGGFSFTLYPLSMAYTCEKVKDKQIVAATGGFVLSYGIGAIAGPLLAPLFMQLFGAAGLFYFISLITFFLGTICLKKTTVTVLEDE